MPSPLSPPSPSGVETKGARVSPGAVSRAEGEGLKEATLQVKQKVYEFYKGTVERVTAPCTVSAFLEKGVLSVPEFILAGDNLVAKCPTWSWEAGDPSKRKPYLPANKQFLVTRNVPCLRRAISVEEEYDAAGAEVVLDEDGEGWLATHGVQGQYPYKCCLVFHSEFYDLNCFFWAAAEPSYFIAEEPEDDNILHTRTYDVSIT
ncbi:Autophagy-related protein 3 [Zea mays]|uniref:Autophagy-related protein 3 n=1 Tax=Zea mays TaxID=4577 RepID=A0A1D6GJM9_MAIZE|nr:Autophagy-related protein 3 [Zea mays]